MNPNEIPPKEDVRIRDNRHRYPMGISSRPGQSLLVNLDEIPITDVERGTGEHDDTHTPNSRKPQRVVEMEQKGHGPNLPEKDPNDKVILDDAHRHHTDLEATRGRAARVARESNEDQDYLTRTTGNYRREAGSQDWGRDQHTPHVHDESAENVGSQSRKPQQGHKSMPQDQDYYDHNEPYGSQLLRLLHDHDTERMLHYDSLLQPLDHPDVKTHLVGVLKGMEKGMRERERLHKKLYKGLPPLTPEEEEALEEFVEEEEGIPGEKEDVQVAEDDLEEDSRRPVGEGEDYSEDEEELPPEDAVEGSRTKALKKKKTRRPNRSFHPNPEISEGEKSLHGKRGFRKSLFGHQVKALREAVSFLKDISSLNTFEESHKFISFHLGKSLEPLGALQDVGMKEEEPSDPTPSSKTIQEASVFLKSLAWEKAFGSPHRQKALDLCKDICEFMEEEEEIPGEEMVEEEEEFGEVQEKTNPDPHTAPPGIPDRASANVQPQRSPGNARALMGKKAAPEPDYKALSNTFLQQQQEIQEAQRQVEFLTSKL